MMMTKNFCIWKFYKNFGISESFSSDFPIFTDIIDGTHLPMIDPLIIGSISFAADQCISNSSPDLQLKPNDLVILKESGY